MGFRGRRFHRLLLTRWFVRMRDEQKRRGGTNETASGVGVAVDATVGDGASEFVTWGRVFRAAILALE